MAMIVRASMDRDVDECAAIYGHHVRHGTASFELDPPSRVEMAARRTSLLVRDMPFLVAEEDDVLLGYAYAGPYRARPAYAGTVENSIYVKAGLSGRGIGHALLSQLIRSCEQKQFRQMVAVVGDSGNLASIRLHERCGFRLVGVLRSVGWKHGRWLDSVLLQRQLGQGYGAPPADPL